VQHIAEIRPAFDAQAQGAARYEPPRFEVISLDCEITSYAPDDRPLF
jgi:hypothetical protein